LRSAVNSDRVLYFSGMTCLASSTVVPGSLGLGTCLPVFLFQMISTRYLPEAGAFSAGTAYLPSLISAEIREPSARWPP